MDSGIYIKRRLGLDRHKKKERKDEQWHKENTGAGKVFIRFFFVFFSSIFNWHNHTHSSAGRQVTHMVNLSYRWWGSKLSPVNEGLVFLWYCFFFMYR